MLNLFRPFRAHRQTPVRYSFYVWEDGNYVQVNAAEYKNDWDATEAAQQHSNIEIQSRPASLDSPHLHVVREDGVHIITVDLPERFKPSIADQVHAQFGIEFATSVAA